MPTESLNDIMNETGLQKLQTFCALKSYFALQQTGLSHQMCKFDTAQGKRFAAILNFDHKYADLHTTCPTGCWH